jgi:hypothetical protein
MNGKRIPELVAWLGALIARLADRLFWLTIWPLGIDRELLEKCRKSDRRYVAMVGMLMMLGWVWQVILFTAAAHIMLSPKEWRFDLLGLAVLISTMILLADALIFISCSWIGHGNALLSKTGKYQVPGERSAKVRTATMIGGRFGIVVVFANFFGINVALISFTHEINQVLNKWYLSANGSLIAEHRDTQTRELGKIEQQQTQISVTIAALQAEERRLGGIAIDPAAAEPELRLALAGVARAEAAKTSAERALVSAEQDSANEVEGRCLPRRSCRPGAGPQWRAIQERIKAGRRRVDVATQELAAAQTSLREMQAARAGEMQRKAREAKTRLAEVTQDREAQERQLAALAAEYQRRLLNREQVIREAVEHDPRHVSREEGLIARLRALRELMQEPAVATLVYIFDGMLVFFELATILAKTMSLVPLEYVMRLAQREALLADEIASELSRALGQGANRDVADAGASTRSSRHAPRWRPPSAGSEGEPADNTPPNAPMPPRGIAAAPAAA